MYIETMFVLKVLYDSCYALTICIKHDMRIFFPICKICLISPSLSLSLYSHFLIFKTELIKNCAMYI